MSDHRDESRADLRAKIAERDRLIEELEARNAELERHAYAVSHDLKTPLVSIKGFISFLSRDIRAGDRERIEHDIERVSGAADQMSRLLDDLLELSTVGRRVSSLHEVGLGMLAAEAVGNLAEEIEKRGAEVVIAPDLPDVFGDSRRLVEVLEQLIGNALKHFGDGSSLRIEVGARQDEAESVLYVRDNGPGIDQRYHKKVFGLFERLDPGASEGTGAGLALVKRIVEFHGGKIWIESEGQGSTFCFTLARP